MLGRQPRLRLFALLAARPGLWCAVSTGRSARCAVSPVIGLAFEVFVRRIVCACIEMNKRYNETL